MKNKLNLKHRIKLPKLKLAFSWHSVIIGGLLLILALVFFTQLFYPSDRMLPFTRINGLNYSMWTKADVVRDLKAQYDKSTLAIYFGSAATAYKTPTLADAGIVVEYKIAIDKLDYAWYWRFLPFSVLWHHLLTDGNQLSSTVNSVKLEEYINDKLGDSCSVLSKNASLVSEAGVINLLKGQNGGTCELSAVQEALENATPRIGSSQTVKIAMTEIPPVITDEIALAFRDSLLKKIGDKVALDVNGSSETIATTEIINWLDFATTNDQMSYSINKDRASAYLNSNYSDDVKINAGTTTVTTYNFVETSRVVGSSGKVLDAIKTIESISSYLGGNIDIAVAATKTVAPSVTYRRTYSSTDEGLSSLMKNFAESHSGVFGVSMIEIGGQGRFAAFNENKVFITASTYKLFVAYSSLKRVEDGSWHWSDQIADGRDLTKCLDDMIVKSDNNCGAALLKKIGFSNITNEAIAIGCTSTTFMKSAGIETTASDLMTLLAKLHAGQILNEQSSRNILLNAMSRNIYRAGIPTGLPGISVANKVGFMDGLLHDASIVYSPSGTYVLIVMTNGSSWSTIADLTKQIEALRVQ